MRTYLEFRLFDREAALRRMRRAAFFFEYFCFGFAFRENAFWGANFFSAETLLA